MMEALTAFDAVAILLVILSTLMALARGFLRELATLGAFIAALAAAYYARAFLRQPLADLLPEGLPEWTPGRLRTTTAPIQALSKLPTIRRGTEASITTRTTNQSTSDRIITTPTTGHRMKIRTQ